MWGDVGRYGSREGSRSQPQSRERPPSLPRERPPIHREQGSRGAGEQGSREPPPQAREPPPLAPRDDGREVDARLDPELAPRSTRNRKTAGELVALAYGGPLDKNSPADAPRMVTPWLLAPADEAARRSGAPPGSAKRRAPSAAPATAAELAEAAAGLRGFLPLVRNLAQGQGDALGAIVAFVEAEAARAAVAGTRSISEFMTKRQPSRG